MGDLSDVDAELFRKLSEFATVANRGDVSKSLDAANLVFAHGMFKCGLQRTTDERRAHVLRNCAERFLGMSFEPQQSRQYCVCRFVAEVLVTTDTFCSGRQDDPIQRLRGVACAYGRVCPFRTDGLRYSRQPCMSCAIIDLIDLQAMLRVFTLASSMSADERAS